MEDVTLDYCFSLRLVYNFFIDTGEYYPRCYEINDGKTFKNLVYHFMHCAGKSSYVYCRLSHSSGDFKNHINLVLCIIGSDYKYQTICVRSFSFASGQQSFKIKPVNIQSRPPKKNICWYGTQKSPKTLIFIFIIYKQKKLFSWRKSMKKQSWHAFV